MCDITVGIDLGTTNSCIAIWHNQRLEIITDEFGNKTIPSIVSFNKDNKYVGHDAKHQLETNPFNTFYNIKRFIGQPFDDEIVQHELGLSSYESVRDDKEPSGVLLVNGYTNERITPEEISAMILIKLKLLAQKYLGQPIKNAVITIPAYFNDSQRQATKDAAKIAGFEKIRLLNEPTAAALAYGLYSRNNQNIIVFDLGGGTLDVSLLNIDNGLFQVLAISGNSHLGGEDFDNELLKYCLCYFKKTNNLINLNALTHENIQRLRKACEHAKRILTNNEYATICIDNFYNGCQLFIKINRDLFDQICNHLFLLCLKYVEDVLECSKLKTDDINEIVLVGGSSRMPKIQDLLRTMFKGKELNRTVNPDEVVAAGAALQAYRMTYPDDPFSDNIVLLDVIPLTLGIETLRKIMTPIIARNTTIPVTRTRKFTTDADNMESVLIRIFEGERRMTSDNYLVGSFELQGLKPAARGHAEIIVSYHVDVNGIITIKATEKNSGIEKEIHIAGNKGRLSEMEIDKLINEAKSHELADRLLGEKTELHFNIYNLCKNIRINLKSNDFRLIEEEVTKINNDIKDILENLRKIPAHEWDKNDLEQIKFRINKNYGSLIIKNNDNNVNVGNLKNDANGVDIYSDDEEDAIEEKKDNNNNNNNTRQARNALEELCISLTNLLSDNEIETNNEIEQFKMFLDKVQLWMHIKENLELDEYIKKIDLVNEYTEEIMGKYANLIVPTKKRELENLCYMLKFNVQTSSTDLDELISDAIKLLEHDHDDSVYVDKINEINELCNKIYYENNIDIKENDIKTMGTQINNINKIDKRISNLLVDVEIMCNSNLFTVQPPP